MTETATKRYGLFNDLRSAPSDVSFFAIQVAVSSYPGDPLRKELADLVGTISSIDDHATQSELAAHAMQLLSQAIPFIEFCVWDYTLIDGVAKDEFTSWVDDLQGVAASPPDENDITPFLEGDTTYFVATLSVLSSQPTLKHWLDYYAENLKGPQFFDRKTIEAILDRLGNRDMKILARCTNAMFAIMPRATDAFYSGKRLRSDDWKYLRPIY